MSLNEREKSISIENAIDEANAVIAGLQGFAFPEPKTLRFNCSQLTDKYVKKLLEEVPAGHAKEFEGTDFIYTFKWLSEKADEKAGISRLFREARELQAEEGYDGKVDYCKDNECLSQYLYVGRSKKLRSRLAQHLGARHEGIYAMHLQRWATPISCDIDISYYRIDGKANLVIQAIEDGVWQTLQPMLGRQGEQ